MPITDTMRQQLLFEIRTDAHGGASVLNDIQQKMASLNQTIDQQRVLLHGRSITGDEFRNKTKSETADLVRLQGAFQYVTASMRDATGAQRQLDRQLQTTATAGMRRGQVAAIELGRGIEDFLVAGPIGALNNLNRMIEVGAVGLSTGWVIAATAATSAGYILYKNWDRLFKKADDGIGTIGRLENRIKELNDLKIRPAVDDFELKLLTADLKKAKDGLAAFEEFKNQKTKAQQDRGKAATEVLAAELPGGQFADQMLAAEKVRTADNIRRDSKKGIDDKTAQLESAKAEAARVLFIPGATDAMVAGAEHVVDALQDELTAMEKEVTDKIQRSEETSRSTVGNIIKGVKEGDPQAMNDLVGRMNMTPDRFGGQGAVDDFATKLRNATPPAEVAKAAADLAKAATPFGQGDFGSLVEGELLRRIAGRQDPGKMAQDVGQKVARQIQGSRSLKPGTDVNAVADQIVQKALERVGPNIEANQFQGGGTDAAAAARLYQEMQQDRMRKNMGDQRAAMNLPMQAEQAQVQEMFLQQGENLATAQHLAGRTMHFEQMNMDRISAMHEAMLELLGQFQGMQVGHQRLLQGENAVQAGLRQVERNNQVQKRHARAGK